MPDEIKLSAGYEREYSLAEILERARERWGEDLTVDAININHERVKERGCNCCYDSSDYEDYLVITKNG